MLSWMVVLDRLEAWTPSPWWGQLLERLAMLHRWACAARWSLTIGPLIRMFLHWRYLQSSRPQQRNSPYLIQSSSHITITISTTIGRLGCKVRKSSPWSSILLLITLRRLTSLQLNTFRTRQSSLPSTGTTTTCKVFSLLVRRTSAQKVRTAARIMLVRERCIRLDKWAVSPQLKTFSI